ncbi:hypothetical protein J2W30_004471 [Variovorax boronicumulans]|uniref:DUF262 domain-containing protein n=1 Tax=Variovorax boronicumulans TaxID=436515 RepID=UPI002789CD4C|nr:DUF262 domain-containing protein [Variovorax boronicumulans]MDQ0036696.1 hypothetical protein [Variovorax boronicumulans]
MKASAVSLLALFETKMQFEVPLFQRQYIWKREKHWEPLWEDIARKFSDYLNGRKDAPVHFLGAMVLDQKQTPATHVGKRQVIDGQQRLTTFQIFLSAFRDFCNEHGCTEMAKECSAFTLNKGLMADVEIDRFKVWPTQLDRPQFADVVSAGSSTAILEKYPLQKRLYARKFDARPRMVEAYFFFYEQFTEFFIESDEGPVQLHDVPLAQRVDECFQALKSVLQVVEIDLDHDDDAQVIFETLNARGEPLIPADLLRNFIFLRAARRGEPQEMLYKRFWARFDEPFWRIEVKQGRLLRPRSDLFLQHFLASRLAVDIPIKHLFVEYKFWIDRAKPFESVELELACLARQGDDFRRMMEPEKEDPLHGLMTFLDAFDVRTSYPLVLTFLDMGAGQTQWNEISRILESYLLRRAVCGLSTKNYNRVFLALTRSMRSEGASPENLSRLLKAQRGDSVEWPSDERFIEAWRSQHAYKVLSNPKIVHILKRLSDTYLSSKIEAFSLDAALSVEHILPQQWTNNWPLDGDARGLSDLELRDAPHDDAVAKATRIRNQVLHTLGNLTILTSSLNAAVSNNEWSQKKPELMRHSLLPINQMLYDVEVWNETAIQSRSEALLTRALKIWPS